MHASSNSSIAKNLILSDKASITQPANSVYLDAQLAAVLTCSLISWTTDLLDIEVRIGLTLFLGKVLSSLSGLSSS